MSDRCYTELSRIDSYEGRFRYLALHGRVSEMTFGSDRYINQRFYTSREWRQLRNHVIARDLGCDLGIEGYEIFDKIIIHHMNPMSVDNVVNSDPRNLDPEFLITVTHQTHNAIHYGDETRLVRSFTERKPGDTSLW